MRLTPAEWVMVKLIRDAVYMEECVARHFQVMEPPDMEMVAYAAVLWTYVDPRVIYPVPFERSRMIGGHKVPGRVF